MSDGKVVALWNLDTKISQTPLQGHKSGFRSLYWPRHVWTMAFGSYDRITKLWGVEKGVCVHTLAEDEEGPSFLLVK